MRSWRYRIGISLFLIVASMTVASAACPTFTAFANGNVADANPVMNNFNYILQCPVFARNVGIGIPSAAYSLQVNTGIDQNLAVYQPLHFTSGVTLQSTTDAGSALQPLELRGTSFDLADGNVGIGIANAAYKLQVNTGANQNFAVYRPVHFGSGVTLQSTTDTGSSLLPLELRGSSIDLADGYVGIGTSSPAQALDVSGTIRQSACVSASLQANGSGDIICTVSDARLKNIRGEYEDGLDAILRITPRRFTYKPTASDSTEILVHVGFIAQNVKEVIPEAVAIQHSGYYSLDTTAILAASVNAIKQLKADNDRQSAEVRYLLKAVSRQDQEISTLKTSLAIIRNKRRVQTASN